VRILSHRAVPLVALALVGCNALLGIEDATLEDTSTLGPDAGRPADASGEASTDGSRPSSDASTDGNANDAGSIDAADAQASDASDDAADAAVAVDAADAGDAGGGVDASCTSSQPKMASKALVNYGPAIAFDSNVWGIVWHGGAETIQFNAVDSAGNIQNGSDVTAVAASANVTYGTFPRVASAGGSLALAYGVKSNTGTAATFPAARTIHSSTGATIGGPANGVSANDSATPDVGGVVVTSAGTIGTVGRLHSLTSATQTWMNLFTSTPSSITGPLLTQQTLTTSIAWSEGKARFGAAYVVDSTQAGGQIATYDTDGVHTATFPFSAAGDAPVAGLLPREVSIASAGDRFAVVWLDGDPALNVKVTTVDALSGGRLPVGAVQANGTGTVARGFPRIAYDGKSLAIAWVEGSSGNEQVYLRRYTPGLVPLDAEPRCVSCGLGKVTALSAIGLAASAPNDYGLAFMLGTSGSFYQYFTHITCVGP
jgi:hypothetical protein